MKRAKKSIMKTAPVKMATPATKRCYFFMTGMNEVAGPAEFYTEKEMMDYLKLNHIEEDFGIPATRIEEVFLVQKHYEVEIAKELSIKVLKTK